MSNIFQLSLKSMGSKNLKLMVTDVNQKDLLFIKDLLEAGKVKSIIDKRYPLNETSKAIRYLEEGHARGKIVITV